jgi:hypothetical protein
MIFVRGQIKKCSVFRAKKSCIKDAFEYDTESLFASTNEWEKHDETMGYCGDFDYNGGFCPGRCEIARHLQQ